MIRVFSYLIIILLGLTLSPYLVDSNGYIYIAIGDYQIETSVIFGILTIILLFAAIQICEWLLVWLITFTLNSRFLPERWKRFSARNQTLNGILAMVQQNWPKAEKMLVKSARRSQLPLMNLLAAAKAADQQQNFQARDEYLARAELLPQAKDAVAVTRLGYLVGQGKWQAASEQLAKDGTKVTQSIALAKLATKIYLHNNELDKLIKLLPTFKKKRLLSAEKLQQVERDVYFQRLFNAAKTDLQELENEWKSVPKNHKTDALFLTCYANGLESFKQHDKAIKLLLKCVKKQHCTQLLNCLAKLTKASDKLVISYFEDIEVTMENNANYHQAMAIVKTQLKQFKQAKYHWQKVCQLAPTNKSWLLLGELQQQLGDNQSALYSFHQAALIN